MDNNTILERIIEKRQRLDELKARSPEATEAVQLADEINCLLEQLSGGEQIRYVPTPYPVPLYPTWITVRYDTSATNQINPTVAIPNSTMGKATYIIPDTTGAGIGVGWSAKW